eukprot:TRINITY_DN5661_c0_g1_i7.p1 TRINITY_DN5661_c0_g1~~TRINITY_DN5661_c0_g1_i7.p1  ORF type:complete len:580 (-),score=-0.58 TRINITY_DN5661_c0_g1_i7:227-1966(-)
MRLSAILRCIVFNQLGTDLKVRGKNIPYKIERLQRFSKYLYQYPPPKHYKGVQNLDMQWIAGFYQGDGSVKVYLVRTQSRALNAALQARFVISQTIKSYYIIQDLSSYYPLVGYNNFKIHQVTRDIAVTKITSYKDLKRTLFKMKGLFVGDKWFDYTICSYISQQLSKDFGKCHQKFVSMANYVVQNQKEYKTVTERQLKKLTRAQISTMNQINVLEQVKRKATSRGIPVPKLDYNELVPYLCHLPHGSLDERFILGFIEAEGCFHVNLGLTMSNYPLIQPSLRFMVTQKGDKNVFVLFDILDKFGGKGSLMAKNERNSQQIPSKIEAKSKTSRQKLQVDTSQGLQNFLKQIQNNTSDNTLYQLQIKNQSVIRDFLVPFFQRHVPLTNKYYDFEKFAEVSFGNHAGKNKSQGWIRQVVYSTFSMNNGVDYKSKRQFVIQQYLFYMGLANSYEDVKLKKRNLQIFQQLIFNWVLKWKHINVGTKLQQKNAINWLKNLELQKLEQLDRGTYDEVIQVLDFVAGEVSKFEQHVKSFNNVDHQWLFQFSQSNAKYAKLKCRPLLLILDQIDLDNREILPQKGL